MTADRLWVHRRGSSRARRVVLPFAIACGLAARIAPGQGVERGGAISGTPVKEATPSDLERLRLADHFERLGGSATWSEGGPGKPMMNVSLGGDNVTDAAMSAREAPLDRVQHLFIGDTKLTDAGLGFLKRMSGLETLRLRGDRYTDDALAHLGTLTRLRGLEIQSDSFTDAGLAHIAGLEGLMSLSFSSKRYTDAGLAHLAGLKGLDALSLPRTLKIGNAGLAHIKGLKNLTYLDARLSLVGDAGMANLEGMERMESLFLGSTHVGDAGLEHLSGLDRLRTLSLDGTPVTGAGLARLKGLPRLEWLCLEDRQVTDEGLENLKGFPAITSLLVIGMDADSARTAATRRALPRVDLPSGSPRLPDPRRGTKGPTPANAPRPGN